MAASNGDLFKKVSRRWVGQIGAGGVSDSSTTTVPLSSATNLPTGTAVVVVIDRVDANGTSTAATEETIIGVVSGSNLVNCVRGSEGTAQAHDAGAVVEVLHTAKGWNDLIDGLIVEHNQIGGHTNITACNITASGTFNLSVAAGHIKVAGANPKRTIYVPATAMFPSTTGGCAALTQVESTTNDVNIKVLDFDGAGTTKESAEFGVQSPTYWDASTITVQFVWYATAGSGTVNWEAQAVAFSDDDALDAAYGTLQEVTDTLLATGDVHISAETAAITVAGTPAAGDWINFRVNRDPANDTNTSDARLMGVRIRFGIKQYNDA